MASAAAPDVVQDSTVDENLLDVAVLTGDVAVPVPSDPDPGIDLFLPGSDDFTIGLPFADDAVLTATGAGVSFDNGNGSSTVPLVQDGGVVQLLTTIATADAPTDYSYVLDIPDGVTLSLMDDGGAEVVNANGDTIATVETPWAVDANGNAVATHYEVAGDTLTQVIDFTSGTAFPVVADPKISYGVKVYMTYTKAETKKYAGYTAYATVASGVCPFLKFTAITTAICVGAFEAYAVSIDKTFNEAARLGKCVEFGFPYFPTAVTIALQARWKVVTCS